MSKSDVPDEVEEAHEKLSLFRDGRIDYSDAETAPIVVLFLKYEDEILILKRSRNVGTHPNRWGLVAGYLDELKTVREKGLEELEEETGISGDEVSAIKEKGKFKWTSDEEGITYIPHILLVELEEKPDVEISWEHEEYKWVKIEDAEKYLSSNAMEELRMAIS